MLMPQLHARSHKQSKTLVWAWEDLLYSALNINQVLRGTIKSLRGVPLIKTNQSRIQQSHIAEHVEYLLQVHHPAGF